MEKKFVLMLLMVVLINMSGFVTASTTTLIKSFPTPGEIDDMITSGIAVPHGVQFENQGIGCRTFYVKESENSQTFYFTRDGKSFGEYREDFLYKGKYMRTNEFFITKSARDPKFLKDAKEIPFIRKFKMFHWKGDLWFESIIKWSIEIHSRNGKELRQIKQDTEITSRVTVLIAVPTDLMNKDKEYYFAVYKHKISGFDREFYNDIHEGKGLRIQWKKVERCGLCEMTFEWSRESPELLYELHERIYIPDDATPFFIRTKCIASMIRATEPAHREIITFEPTME